MRITQRVNLPVKRAKVLIREAKNWRISEEITLSMEENPRFPTCRMLLTLFSTIPLQYGHRNSVSMGTFNK